jgi:hypothetical protein
VVIAIGICALVLLVSARARAGSPEINLIERFLANQVLLHFDTEPNRSYVLQFGEKLFILCLQVFTGRIYCEGRR